MIKSSKTTTFLENFFRQIIIKKKCDECQIQFKNCRQKKNHNFLFHKNQETGGSINQQGHVNVLRRGPIIYYSINYN